MKSSKIVLIIICLLTAFTENINAQHPISLSDKAHISVLTCGPGDVLYTAFGHSSIRVQDPEILLDKVYNYGTFDFNAPNFYLNFAKGKLTYMLSVSRTNQFLAYYNYENRWVKEQYLDLSKEEEQAIFNFLENNAKPENRSYQYDFFYDNCSTKIEEVLQKALGHKIEFSNEHITTTKTHRDLIEDYTGNNNWGKFGIDLALGAVIDAPASKQDYKFIPDYMFEGIATAKLNSVPLTYKTVNVLQSNNNIQNEWSIFSPYSIITILGILIILITYIENDKKKRFKAIDVLLFLITGLIGTVVLLLWFSTDHTATYDNYNFLWAFPLNLFVAFYLMKKNLPNWLPKYLMFLISGILGTVVLWVSGYQIFNPAIIPLLVALTVRYLYLLKYLKIKD